MPLNSRRWSVMWWWVVRIVKRRESKASRGDDGQKGGAKEVERRPMVLLTSLSKAKYCLIPEYFAASRV